MIKISYLKDFRWLFCLSIALILFFRFSYNHIIDPGSIFLMDFNVYHFTANLILQGKLDIYHLAYQNGFEFKYAPFCAILFTPLALFSLQTASVMWEFLNFIFLISYFLISEKIIQFYGFTHRSWYFLLAFIFIITPLWANLGVGQSDIVQIGLIFIALYLYLKEKKLLSALLLSLAMSLKIPALIFLLFFVVKKDLKMMFQTLFIFLGLNFLACLFLNFHNPLQPFKDWQEVLRTTSPNLQFIVPNQSLYTFLFRYFGTGDSFCFELLKLSKSAIFWLYGFISVVMVSVPLLLARFSKESRAKDLSMLGILVLLMVLLSPVVWSPNYVIFIFPILFILSMLKGLWQSKVRTVVSISIFLLIFLDFFTHKKAWRLVGLLPYKGEHYPDLVFMIYPMMGLLLYFLLLMVLTYGLRHPEDEHTRVEARRIL